MDVNQERINQYLSRIDPAACPLCGNEHWNLTSKVFQAIEYEGRSMLAGRAVFPVVALSCTRCGYTRFVNAFVAGLVDRPTDDENDGKSAAQDAGYEEKRE